MIVKIDRALYEFTYVTQTDECGDLRRYYVHTGDRLMIIVCRDSLDLGSLMGYAVDAQVGDDGGTRGFVKERNVGRRHTKLTIYRKSRKRTKNTLRGVLYDAPRE